MKILYITQYFAPEIGASQIRATALTAALARAGHQVTVVTAMPNHPQGVIHLAYRGRLWASEKVNGIRIIRLWIKTSPVASPVARMVSYLSFLAGSLFAGTLLTMARRFDLVYVTSPPLPAAAAALWLKKIFGIPMVFEVRDLWPESAIALGQLKNPLLTTLGRWLEKQCYQQARHIVTVSRGLKERIAAVGHDRRKISVIFNGAITISRRAEAKPPESVFLVIYAGLMGLAQGLETVLRAAFFLKDDPGIRFCLMGEGPCKKRLLEMKYRLKLDNVTFRSAVCPDLAHLWLTRADLALVPLRRMKLFKSALPAKLFAAWGCGLPVVLTVDGEARRLLDKARAGVYVPPESPGRLAGAIRKLARDPAACRRYGRNGRQLVAAEFRLTDQARRLTDLLEKLVASC
jgi:glycosyltransferase involved in cell wall biosynthesis